MEWEERFMDRSRSQEGLLAWFQLGELGCTRDQWWSAKSNGRWTTLSPRVIGPRGAPDSQARRALAAAFDSGPGSVLHWRSTLAWLGFRAFDLRDLHVARLRGGSTHQPSLAKLHQLRDLRPHDIVVVRGVPTESALRAIWAEAERYAGVRRQDLGYERVGRLLDEGHRLSVVTWAGLHEMVDGIQQRGRGGTVIMRALAAERLPGTSPTESNLEARLEKLLADIGARELRRQVVVGGHEPIGRADHRDAELPLAVETNSLQFHTTPSDQAADELRYRRLIEAGFTVGVVWEPDLWQNPRGATDTVALARRHAAAGDRVVVHSPGCPWPNRYLGAGP